MLALSSIGNLLKSKSCMDKISYRISACKNTSNSIYNLDRNNCTIKSIEETAK